MREIKFRAFYKNHLYNVLGISIERDRVRVIRSQKSDTKGDVNISDVALMQFTGLEDKNGCEIFEGDIIVAFDPILLEWGKPYAYSGVVQWLDNSLAWGIVDERGEFLNLLCRAEAPKVVGNIYENQELLNSTKKVLGLAVPV